MSSSVVHDPRVHDSRLVADGPYRYLRNPLYLGDVLVAFGIGAGGQPQRFLLMLLAFPFFSTG